MTLIVEDGTGVADADAYVSMDDCAAYAASHGLTFATSPSTAGEAAIIRATAWIDANYGARFPGIRTHGRSQVLMWPRSNATDAEDNDIASDEVPVEIVNATCEAAVREFATAGSLAPDLERGGGIRVLKAGSVEIEYGANALATTVFQIIDGILSSLLGAGQSSYTARASRG